MSGAVRWEKCYDYIFNEGMKRILKDALPFHDYESDALAMAKAVKILRREVLSWKSLPFNGQFQPECQSKSLPTTLKCFVSNLLNGPGESVQSEFKDQASLTIAQLIYFKPDENIHQWSLLVAGTIRNKSHLSLFI